MEIREYEKFSIITPLSQKLDKREFDRLDEEIYIKRNQRIGIDLTNVCDCTIDFIIGLKKYSNINLFNIHSDIFALLINMKLDKTINLFVSELDFINNKHQLLNRSLHLV